MFSHIFGMESSNRQSLWFSFAAVLSISLELFGARRDVYKWARFEFNDGPAITQSTSFENAINVNAGQLRRVQAAFRRRESLRKQLLKGFKEPLLLKNRFY